jgi:iron complex outermembrane receptor protein
VNISGRYDKYSSGQDAFSPKVGVKFTPVREIAFRGTWSKGFRIGSFAESNALPTTGYVTGTNIPPDSYAALFPSGRANAYLANYSLGLTQVGNPDLDPEKSRNITIGVVAEPIRNFSFSVDYWDIKKDDVITGADITPAIAAYYAGQPIPAGFTIIPDTVPATDFGAPAGTLPRIAFVQYSYINAATQRASGIDFAAAGRLNIGRGVTWSGSLQASYLRRLDTCYEGTGCQRFAGTIGPYVITSAAGSPRWRGSLQNTLEFGPSYVTLTGFYTSGYGLEAEDFGGERGNCDTSLGAHFNNGDTQCRAKKTLYWNLTTGTDITENVNLYLNINNIFDKMPPLDTATYGGYLYNPAWGNPMIIGRYFRVGAKIKM